MTALTREKDTTVATIRVNVPPDHTPEEEEALVAAVAAAYEESHGITDVTIEVERPEEVDYRRVSQRANDRWNR
jgi:Co/Zn/Cd efflux system component